MSKQDHDAAPPKFIKPGDDPEVDRLLAKLKADCDDGDPFYVDFRKRPRPGADGEQVDAEAVEHAAQVGVARSSRDAAASKQRRQTKLIGLGVLGIVGPIIVLSLGYLMSKPTVVVVAPAALGGPGQTTAAAAGVDGTARGTARAPVAPAPAASMQGDAGAARPPAESSAAAPVKGRPWPKKVIAGVDAGAVDPGAGRPDPGEDIW